MYEGPIPTEVGRMTALQEIVMAGNTNIDGTIPTQVGLLTNLRFLDLSRTATQGKVPEELCARAKQGELELVLNCTSVECCA